MPLSATVKCINIIPRLMHLNAADRVVIIRKAEVDSYIDCNNYTFIVCVTSVSLCRKWRC